MKKKLKLALIVALLIAVIAVSFGILREHKARNEEAAASTESIASEQQEDENDKPLATLFFASDYQPEEGFDDPSETLSNILDAAETDGKTIDRVIMCGDYSSSMIIRLVRMLPLKK